MQAFAESPQSAEFSESFPFHPDAARRADAHDDALFRDSLDERRYDRKRADRRDALEIRRVYIQDRADARRRDLDFERARSHSIHFNYDLTTPKGIERALARVVRDFGEKKIDKSTLNALMRPLKTLAMLIEARSTPPPKSDRADPSDSERSAPAVILSEGRGSEESPAHRRVSPDDHAHCSGCHCASRQQSASAVTLGEDSSSAKPREPQQSRSTRSDLSGHSEHSEQSPARRRDSFNDSGASEAPAASVLTEAEQKLVADPTLTDDERRQLHVRVMEAIATRTRTGDQEAKPSEKPQSFTGRDPIAPPENNGSTAPLSAAFKSLLWHQALTHDQRLDVLSALHRIGVILDAALVGDPQDSPHSPDSAPSIDAPARPPTDDTTPPIT